MPGRSVGACGAKPPTGSREADLQRTIRGAMTSAPDRTEGLAGRPVVVVPCFNEAARLDAAELLRLAETVDVWLVDDGSTDDTRAVCERIAASSGGRIVARANAQNSGKAETVRTAMLDACRAGAPVT